MKFYNVVKKGSHTPQKLGFTEKITKVSQISISVQLLNLFRNFSAEHLNAIKIHIKEEELVLENYLETVEIEKMYKIRHYSIQNKLQN